MATISGDQIKQGSRVKIDGRWLTITSDPQQGIIGGEPYPRMRVADACDSKGNTRPVRWFTDDVMPVGHTTATVISFENYQGRGVTTTVTVEIVYRRREWGGWAVKLASNGRDLGWVVQPYGEKTWDAHASSSAFRGTGPNDEGHVLDEVSAYLYNGVSSSPLECYAVAPGCRNRDEATQELIRRLHDKSAPALGFGAHYAVTPYRTR